MLVARSGPTKPTRATARARKEPTGSTPELAHVRQPRTTAVSPAWGSTLDRNEEHGSGLRRGSVGRNKGGDGLARSGRERPRKETLEVALWWRSPDDRISASPSPRLLHVTRDLLVRREPDGAGLGFHVRDQLVE